MKNKLYLVGDAESQSNNDWLAVCKTREEAERLLALLANSECYIKEVTF